MNKIRMRARILLVLGLALQLITGPGSAHPPPLSPAAGLSDGIAAIEGGALRTATPGTHYLAPGSVGTTVQAYSSTLDMLSGSLIRSTTLIPGSIGFAGQIGFGVGVCPAEYLPAGWTGLTGYDDPKSDNYGNYSYAGSTWVWIPKFYYRSNDGTSYTANLIQVAGTDRFATTALANAAGFALHRAFIDGGVEQPGFFIGKYEASSAVSGTGTQVIHAASTAPLSTNAAHNPVADITASGGVNAYYAVLDAAKGIGETNGVKNASSIFFASSRFQHAALAILSKAHADATAAAGPACAWWSSTSPFPKGNNSNTLSDVNDSTITYTTDGYSTAGLTGSGKPFAKTTHNGQPSGVADLNGNMYEINIGITSIATTAAIESMSQANPCVIGWTGHGLSTNDYVQIGTTQITQADWSGANSKIWKITKVNDNSFSIEFNASGFGTPYNAETDPGTMTKITFYVANESTRMAAFTSGATSATDHWGATGVAAMMQSFTPVFKSGGGFAQKYGSGSGLVISAATNGNGWILGGLGLPSVEQSIDSSGTTAFGQDYYYQYFIGNLCLLSSCDWDNGSSAGVWGVYWGNARTGSDGSVGFRAACYLVN
jgi:hypothetical protein